MTVFERFLRTVHRWLGLFVMPLVIVIGLTGFYLNHSKEIYPVLPNGTFDEADIDLWPDPATLSEDQARAIALSVWPREEITKTDDKSYHDRPAYQFVKESGRIIVTKETGYYWVKTPLIRKTINPAGDVVNRKYYYGRMFKNLHTNGWIDGALGSWLADIAAGAMVFFGLSGLILFTRPGNRKRKSWRSRTASLRDQE